MKRKTIFPPISAFFMIILISYGNGFASALTTHNLEWKVEIGDSQTYIYYIYYDIREAIPNQYRVSGTDVNGHSILVFVGKDTELRYTITSKAVTGSLQAEITINSIVTLIEEPIPALIIIKTIDDKSYWENNESFSIQGNLLVQETISQDIYFDGSQAFPYTRISTFKWNWNTGWLTYFYNRAYFENETYYEEEFEAESVEESTSNLQFQPNVIFGFTFLCIIFAILLAEKKSKSDK